MSSPSPNPIDSIFKVDPKSSPSLHLHCFRLGSGPPSSLNCIAVNASYLVFCLLACYSVVQWPYSNENRIMSFLVGPSMAPRVKVRLYDDLQDLTGHDISPHLLKTADPTILSSLLTPSLLSSPTSFLVVPVTLQPQNHCMDHTLCLENAFLRQQQAHTLTIFSMNPTLKTLFIIATYSYFSYTLNPP